MKRFLIIFSVCLLLFLACWVIFSSVNTKEADIELGENPKSFTLNMSDIRQKTSMENSDFAPESILDISISENDDGKGVFVFSIDEFISCYNSLYQQNSTMPYLTPAEKWTKTSHKTPWFEYEADHYRFSEDYDIYPMPAISIYTPVDDSSSIYAVELSFDDHGFQEMSLVSFDVFFPDMEAAEKDTLFNTLFSNANDNYLGEYLTYLGTEMPDLSVIYRHVNTGIISYYGAGTINFCFCPASEKLMDELSAKGVTIKDIDWN